MFTIAFLALTYVFVPGGPNVVSANLDLQRALAIRREHGSRFLWFKRDGREYVIRDRETLERVDALFADARAMDPDMERLRAKMRPLEDRENELDREADAISDDDHRTRRDEERLRDLQRELRDVESRLGDYEREEERLDRQRDRLEMEAEKKMIPIVDDAIRRGIAKRD